MIQNATLAAHRTTNMHSLSSSLLQHVFAVATSRPILTELFRFLIFGALKCFASASKVNTSIKVCVTFKQATS